MTSTDGGWEKVGGGGAGGGAGSKKQGHKKTSNSKNGQQQVKQQPRLEDVLGAEQISRLQALMPEESTLPVQEAPPQNKAKKKVAPDQQQQQQNSKKEANKKKEVEKPPRTVEEAVAKVSSTKLANLLATVKAQYPNNGILWLKDAASYFNLTLNAETPIDLSNPFLSKPLSLLTKETRRVLTSTYEECGDQMRESAFDNLLANMAHDMGKNQCPNGYMVVLQSLAEVYPSMCVNNRQRFHELIRSYQNRPAIATALVWALGQGGRKDLAIGLKVWGEFISELLPYKNYSRFAVDYLSGLLEHHADKVEKLRKDALEGKGSRLMYSGQFFKVFDVIFGTGSLANVNKQLKTKLLEQYPTVKAISIGECAADHELFPEFLRRLDSMKQKEAGEGDARNVVDSALRDECLSSLCQCLSNNPAAVKHWQQMYASYLPASADLLSHICDDWKRLSRAPLARNADLRDTLAAFDEYNDGIVAQKEGLAAATDATRVRDDVTTSSLFSSPRR